MKIIPPRDIPIGSITSNVAITETEWVAGAYGTGVQRYEGATLYEVVASPDTSDQPSEGVKKDPPSWIEIGSINRHKMFDFRIGDATEQAAGDIDVTIAGDDTVANGIGFFGLEGRSVRVVVTDAVEGVVYDKTQDLSDYTGINNFYDWLFAPAATKTETAFVDLPAYRGADVRVVVSANGDDTAVGELVLGRISTLGVTLINFELGIENFSRKERDSFGRFQIVERGFAKISSYDVFVSNSEVNATFRSLAEIRATPAVYIGADDMPETIALGFYKDFSVLRTGPNSSEMTLEVEGLI